MRLAGLAQGGSQLRPRAGDARDPWKDGAGAQIHHETCARGRAARRPGRSSRAPRLIGSAGRATMAPALLATARSTCSQLPSQRSRARPETGRRMDREPGNLPARSRAAWRAHPAARDAQRPAAGDSRRRTAGGGGIPAAASPLVQSRSPSLLRLAIGAPRSRHAAYVDGMTASPILWRATSPLQYAMKKNDFASAWRSGSSGARRCWSGARPRLPRRRPPHQRPRQPAAPPQTASAAAAADARSARRRATCRRRNCPTARCRRADADGNFIIGPTHTPAPEMTRAGRACRTARSTSSR